MHGPPRMTVRPYSEWHGRRHTPAPMDITSDAVARMLQTVPVPPVRLRLPVVAMPPVTTCAST